MRDSSALYSYGRYGCSETCIRIFSEIRTRLYQELACGEFDPKVYTEYITRKYSDLYGLK